MIIDGIREGRRTFSNIVKYVIYTISGNFGDMYTVGGASIFLPFLPLLPSQLLLANFLTDTPLVAVSTDNVEKEELIRPRRWDINYIFKFSGILGAVSAIFDALLIIMLVSILNIKDDLLFRTTLFLEIVLSEILVLFVIRSDKFFLRSEPPSFKLALSTIVSVFVTFMIIYMPINAFFEFTSMPFRSLIFVGLITTGYIIVTEVVKLAYFKKLVKPWIFFHLEKERYLREERMFIRKRRSY